MGGGEPGDILSFDLDMTLPPYHVQKLSSHAAAQACAPVTLTERLKAFK